MKNPTLMGAAIVVLILFASYFMVGSPTGFILIEEGEATGVGEQGITNPKYGIIYGTVMWEIKDGENTVNTEIPDQETTVYFVPIGEDIDWTSELNCTEEIEGDIENLDADGNATQCITYTYTSPTSSECMIYNTTGYLVDIYTTTISLEEGNEGCFAAKLKAKEYDIYV